MASSILNVFGRSNDTALPASLTRSGASLDTAFEVFIEGALTKIYNEAGGRSKEQRAVREACKKVLGETLVQRACCLQPVLAGRAEFQRPGLCSVKV